MGATKMPNELECLAARLVGDTQELVIDTQVLPSVFCAANKWQQDFKTPGLAADVLLAARALQFDATRLAALVQTHDAALRKLYSQSLYLVDNLRLAVATQSKPAAPFLAAGLNTLADMQEVIAALFPGDTCISS